MPNSTALQKFKSGSLNIEIHLDRESMGAAAAADAATEITRLGHAHDEFGVIFATGDSQLSMLSALTANAGLPWTKILGFHLDEYIAIAPDHPASFRGYLRRNLLDKVPMKAFYEIDGTAEDIGLVLEQYAVRLRRVRPQLCLLGVGENGHLAFNDPGEADFDDAMDVKVVQLDTMCRQQQAAEGWFPSLDAVPHEALTVTIPAIFRVPRLVLSAPGPRKAAIVRRILEEDISTDCPATILKRHPNATLYLDQESAAHIPSSLTT